VNGGERDRRRRWLLNGARLRCRHGGFGDCDSNRARHRGSRRGLLRGRPETPFRCGWRRRVHQLGPEAVDRVCLLGSRSSRGFGHGRGGGFGACPCAERSQTTRTALALGTWLPADRAEPGCVGPGFGNLRRPG
jgi:hypothetical protein